MSDQPLDKFEEDLLDLESVANRLSSEDWSPFYEKTVRRAAATLRKLHDAIKTHHEKTTGHSMCWVNDQELWAAIGIEKLHPDPPEWCEFMQQCAEYRASRELIPRPRQRKTVE